MKTVFVVDDSNVNLYIAERSLSNDYRVFTLPSAPAMFNLLENVKPDLILLDINMPKMDGFEALVRLKKDVRYANIPVIFLSTQNDAETKAYGFEIGAADFIDKPFAAHNLLNQIKLHLDMNLFIRRRSDGVMQQKDKILQRMRGTKHETAHFAAL